MPYVRIHRYELFVHSHRAAHRLINDIVGDVKVLARARAIGPYSQHGDLSASIESEVVELPDGFGGRVGSRLSYAASVEDGAEVHPIFPRGMEGIYRFGDRRRPQLRFYWRKRGKLVYTPHVPMGPRTLWRSHPGQKGKHYLMRSVVDVAHRYRMHVRRFR